MKKLGEGWQYSVYDLQNGRVLKKFHSPLKSYWVIFKELFPFRQHSLWVIPSFSKSMKDKAFVSFEVLKRRVIPTDWVGNPKQLHDDELSFEQDKAVPIYDVFAKCDTETMKRIIEMFVIFNKRLLENGIIDKSFNITKNFGLNQNSEMILIDIGELFDDPKKIKAQLMSRVWEKHYVAGSIENKDARDYFIKEMDHAFGVGI